MPNPRMRPIAEEELEEILSRDDWPEALLAVVRARFVRREPGRPALDIDPKEQARRRSKDYRDRKKRNAP